MSFWLYSAFALPLWCAQFALYFILKRRRMSRESLLPKCAGSFLAVASAGLALYLKGEPPLLHTAFWFFLLCVAADALLEIHFVAGMLLFGAAHVCLVIWLWRAAPPIWPSLLLWAAAYGVTALLFRKEIPTMGKMTVPFFLYPALLSCTVALAVPLPFLLGPVWIPSAVGAVCFFVSDMMVAMNFFHSPQPRREKAVMILYWLALYLLSFPLWW